MNLIFFELFFLSSENKCFFTKINNLMRALGRKKHMFFGNALSKSNARAYLKQRKNHSGLNAEQLYMTGTWLLTFTLTYFLRS